jgi:hypothetical protein
MCNQEDANACSRCNYDRRETEAGGQRQPTPPGAAGPQPRRPRNTRRIGSGLLVRGLFETARGVFPHPKRDCPIQVLGGAHDYTRRREPRLGATLRRHLRDHQPLYLKYSRDRFAFRMLLRRQSQPDGTHSAPTYWFRERRRGPRPARLLRRVGGIKPPSQSGHANAQLTFAHSSKKQLAPKANHGAYCWLRLFSGIGRDDIPAMIGAARQESAFSLELACPARPMRCGAASSAGLHLLLEDRVRRTTVG